MRAAQRSPHRDWRGHVEGARYRKPGAVRRVRGGIARVAHARNRDGPRDDHRVDVYPIGEGCSAVVIVREFSDGRREFEVVRTGSKCVLT
jgi:hypothetical protein